MCYHYATSQIAKMLGPIIMATQIEWSRQHKETQRSPERAVLSQLIENT